MLYRFVTRSFLLASLLVAAMAPTFANAISPVTLRGSEAISRSSGDRPVIAASANGRMTAAWAQSSPDGIWVSDFVRGAWLKPVRIPGSQDGESPTIAMSPRGRTLVTWQVEGGDQRSGAIGVSYRAPGGTFAAPIFLGDITNGADSTNASAAINDAGRGVVVWTHSGDATTVQAAFGNGRVFGSTQTLASAASGARVAIDGSGNAIAIFSAAENQLHQALAPAGGTFQAPTVLDALAALEGGVDTNPRIAANANGQVVAGWGEPCDADEANCEQVFSNRMGIGTTTAGITSTRRVSNPHDTGGDATAGPSRKAGGATEVAIDSAGNATMVWEASSASVANVDLWVAHATPAGVFSPTVSFGSTTEANDDEVTVVAADGHVLTAWLVADEAGAPARILVNQAGFPAAGTSATWPTPVTATRSGADADQLGVALSHTGLAGLVFRDGDRIHANVNAARDTRRPGVVLLPRGGSRLAVRNNRISVRVRCAATEGSCEGPLVVRHRMRMGSRVRTYTVGVGRFYVLGGRTVVVRVAMNRVGRAHLRSMGGRMVVQAQARARDAAGNRRTVTRTYTAFQPRRR